MTGKNQIKLSPEDLDRILSDVPPEHHLVVVRRIAIDASCAAQFYSDLVHKVTARWESLVSPEEVAWFKNELLSSYQDVMHDAEGRFKQMQRDLGEDS